MPIEQSRQLLVKHRTEARRRMQQRFLQQFAIPHQRQAAVLARGIDRQNERHHGASPIARSIAYTFPLAFIPHTRRCMTAGKFLAMPLSGRITPFCPVASTRYPCPSAETSPVHSHIMLRVARVSLVILAANGGDTRTCMSATGCSMANGTLGLFDSTSCSAMSRDSNLYDLFMPSTRPSRTTCSTQSCEAVSYTHLRAH